jgi:hypothetical protein
MLQVDTIVQQLQTMAIAEAMAGNFERAAIVTMMLEAYMTGAANISFDTDGEPVADAIDYDVPFVHSPMFPSIDMEQRQIGFKVN